MSYVNKGEEETVNSGFDDDNVLYDHDGQKKYDIMVDGYRLYAQCRQAHESSCRKVGEPPLTSSQRKVYDVALEAYNESELEFLHDAFAFMQAMEGKASDE